MKIKIIFLVLLSAVCFNNLSAQKNNKKITITGTVVDATNLPIMNAIILIDDVKTNSLTDANGAYKVKVMPTATKITIFTFGHGTFEDSIKGRTQIDFKFGVTAKQNQTTEEVVPDAQKGVNTGYSTVKKKNLTTDINSIDGTNKKYASYRNLADMITHEVSGVKVNGNSVNIQDSKNLWGPVYALIVVDGVYMDELPDIPPVNVKSIQVLKGTSAAMYGSRGSGGAIIIKTKLSAE